MDTDLPLVLQDLKKDSEAVRSRCFNFIRSLLEYNSDIKTIIGIERKGFWIIEDYLFTNDLERKYKLLPSTGNLHEINDKSVLVFDDSIRSGQHVIGAVKGLKKACNKIVVGCFFINEDGKYMPIDKIKSSDLRIKNVFFMNKYGSYEDQTKEIQKSGFALYSTLGKNINLDLPMLEFDIPGSNAEEMLQLYSKYIKTINRKWSYISNTSDVIEYSVDFPVNYFNIPSAFFEICNFELLKIRFCEVRRGTKCRISIVAVVLPSLDFSNCNLTKNECIGKDVVCGRDLLCIYCVISFIGDLMIREHYEGFSRFIGNKIKISNMRWRHPLINKFIEKGKVQ